MTTKITFSDVVLAYRKAKVDCFYDRGHITSVAFAEYEENLVENLKIFYERINSDDDSWVRADDFIGTYNVVLKTVKSDKDGPGFSFYSNFKRSLENIDGVEVDFRITGRHSVNFHILSSLWIEKVGRSLESIMSINSYGCRLKYKDIEQQDSDVFSQGTRNFSGHFRPYIFAYKAWQKNGIERIKSSLEDGKKIIAVTADLAKYYHRIDCSFLEDDGFTKFFEISYDTAQSKLNGLLIKSIQTWSEKIYSDESTPNVFKYAGHCGVPIGLGASKVIANLLLTYFDRKVEEEVKPIYYGRYVDDIFLVIEDGNSISTIDEFWSFLEKRLEELKSSPSKRNSNESEYSPTGYICRVPFSKKSLLEFGKNKEKLFFLEGRSGSVFLNALEEALDENSSEWNLPPNATDDIDKFSKEITSATADFSDVANGLRKSDGLSVKRMKLILYLKKFEITVNLLPRTSWEKQIKDFLILISEYTVTPRNISIYSKYFGRIVALAVITENFEIARAICIRISKTFDKLKELVILHNDYLTKSLNYQQDLIVEGIYSGISPSNQESDKYGSLVDIDSRLSFSEIAQKSRILFKADLHQIPFKDSILYQKFLDAESGVDVIHHRISDFEDLPNWKDFKTFCLAIKNQNRECSTINLRSLYFYTRPFDLLELSMILPEWIVNDEPLQSACRLYSRGFEISKAVPLDGFHGDGKYAVLEFAAPGVDLDRTIAFTSLKTDDKSWKALVRGDGYDPDVSRMQRLLDLCRNILKCKAKVDYVLFPELSIPRNLIIFLARKFSARKISIIAGAEYEFRDVDEALKPIITGYVSNQLIYILSTRTVYGVQQIYLKQEKQIAAFHEERELFETGGKILKATSELKLLINHSGFWFSGLICNEFLDIECRSVLRGFVDALFILEWNKDVNTYNALVESASTDIHAFICQVNNRIYGDTRLRAPYKKEYLRDKVRVRGGELDYFVISTLDVIELRKFQSYHRSPTGPFKPVPTGFKISPKRKYRGEVK